MSPPCGVGVFEAGFAVVERDPAVESLVYLDFGARKGEAAVLGWDLETAALPLHDIVVADDALVSERADAVEFTGSRTPGFGSVARSPRETAGVSGGKGGGSRGGRGPDGGLGEAGEHAPTHLPAHPPPVPRT